jgi:L-fucose mutarotase
MLIGISPLISPELLAALDRMGHGDEIVLADAHFPGESVNSRVIRADGLKVAPLLDAILFLFALDKTEIPLVMMAPAQADTADPIVEQSFWKQVVKHWPDTPPIAKIDRYAFYERTKKAFAVVMTGETATYANIILKKGVTPVQIDSSNDPGE